MGKIDWQKTAQKIMMNVFQISADFANKFSLGQIAEKFAFDIALPKDMKDSTTGEAAWSIVENSEKYITHSNMERIDREKGWMQEKRDFQNIGEIISAWKEINYITTNRLSNTDNAPECDTVYGSENIFHSTNCFDSKNLIFCDGCSSSEYLIASRRSANSNFCIRFDDSTGSSNSFSINYSNKIVNSLFIQDSFDLYECMFCSHLAGKKFCIANMQFSESEYREIRAAVVKWILNS